MDARHHGAPVRVYRKTVLAKQRVTSQIYPSSSNLSEWETKRGV